MNTFAVRKGKGSPIVRATIALMVTMLGILSEVRGQQTAVPEKPTRIQFDQADAARAAAPEKSKERADAARKTMKMASDMAWQAFDAANYEEAATWFERSAELKMDSHVNARAYWEEYRRSTVEQTETALAARIEEFQAQLVTAEESKKGALKTAIDALEKIHYAMSYSSLSMLETVAREKAPPRIWSGTGSKNLRSCTESSLIWSSLRQRNMKSISRTSRSPVRWNELPASRRKWPPSMRRKKTFWQPSTSELPCPKRCRNENWKIP